jgi:hypothetical protein
MSGKIEHIIKWADSAVPESGKQYMRPAFEGDRDAAFSLMCACHDHQRADIVTALWALRVPPETFKVALAFAMGQTHHYSDVRAAAGSRARLVRWCRYAKFNLPSDLPEDVKIYRGVRDCSVKAALRGLSWTLEFDVAAWFATRWKASNPLVISAIMRRPYLVYFDDAGGSEREVLPASVPSNYSILRGIDAGGPLIQEAADRYEDHITSQFVA